MNLNVIYTVICIRFILLFCCNFCFGFGYYLGTRLISLCYFLYPCLGKSFIEKKWYESSQLVHGEGITCSPKLKTVRWNSSREPLLSVCLPPSVGSPTPYLPPAIRHKFTAKIIMNITFSSTARHKPVLRLAVDFLHFHIPHAS